MESASDGFSILQEIILKVLTVMIVLSIYILARWLNFRKIFSVF